MTNIRKIRIDKHAAQNNNITLDLLTTDFYIFRNLSDLGILTFIWPIIYLGEIQIMKLDPDINRFYYYIDLCSNVDNEKRLRYNIYDGLYCI